MKVDHFFKLFKENKKKLSICFLLVILFLATLLRTFYLEKTIDWMDDIRDLMVVKYIFLFKENIFVRPLASQGFDILSNTPVYYWILTFFYSLSSSFTHGVLFFFVLAGVVTVLVNYLWAKELLGKKVALLLAFFSSVSIVFIESSRNILQPYLNNLIYSLLIYFLVLFYKSNKFSYLISSLSLLFLTLFIHLSFLAVIPFFILSYLILIKLKSDNKKQFVLRFLWFVFFCLFFVFLYLFLSENNLSNVFHYFNSISENNSFYFSPSQSFVFFHFLLKENHVLWGMIFFLLFIFYLFFVFFGKSKLVKKNNIIFYILMMIFLSVSLFALVAIDFPFFYFFPFYSLFFFCLSVIIVELAYSNKLISLFIFILLTILFSLKTHKYVTDVFWMLKADDSRDFYRQSKVLSEKINQDLMKNNYSDFVINSNRISYEGIFNSQLADWDILGFYYFLEDFNDKKYLDLVESIYKKGERRSINNFLINYQSTETPDVIYFACVIRDYELLQRTDLQYLDENYCLGPYWDFINGCYRPANLTYELLFSEIGQEYPSPYVLYKLNFDKQEMNNACLSYFDYLVNHDDI